MTAIAFRMLDLEGDVVPWWELEGPVPVVRAYLEEQSALEYLDQWIVTDDERRPFAYVETYRVPDDPLAQYYAVEAGDRGFHLLVGPRSLLGSGIAQTLIRHLVTRLLGQLGITRVVCEPDARNVRMLAVCRALGGEDLATIDMPGRRAVLIGWTREPA